MRVLVISDIHGNLPALEYVLKQEQDSELVISLGDVVNYGPWSNECVDLLESLDNKVLISGNHEEAFISGEYPGSNEIVKAFFSFCYPEFNRKKEIRNYKERYSFADFEFIHTLNNNYIFPDTEIVINKNTFIGHSHKMFMREINSFKLVNTGSVGQNRTNADIVNYVKWDSDSNDIKLIRKNFSSDKLLKEMLSKGYPEICINYIESKRN